MVNVRTILCLLMLGIPYAIAQSPVLVPESHASATGGSIDAYKNMPPDLRLTPKEAGGRSGQVWVRNTGSGLLIAGQVDGNAPDFPRDQSRVLAKDHIEVWLAAAPDVTLPAIGWGNQFGEQLLPRGPDS